jgi:hypothetical protein
MKRVLATLEPIAFHENMLKIHCKKGMREVPKEPMLELLEFVCDVDPSSPFNHNRNLVVICAALLKTNQANQQRGKNLRLPVDWALSGFFKISEEDGSVVLKQGDEAIRLPDAVKTATKDELFVESNFSLARAKLRSRVDASIAMNCQQLFFTAAENPAGDEVRSSASGVVSPAPKRRKIGGVFGTMRSLSNCSLGEEVVDSPNKDDKVEPAEVTPKIVPTTPADGPSAEASAPAVRLDAELAFQPQVPE